jgi:hypothetical protein
MVSFFARLGDNCGLDECSVLSHTSAAHGGAPENIARPARVGMRVQEDFSFFDRRCRSVGALDGTNNRT